MYRLVTLLMDHKEDLDENAKRHRQKVVDFIRKTLKLAQVGTVIVGYREFVTLFERGKQFTIQSFFSNFEPIVAIDNL